MKMKEDEEAIKETFFCYPEKFVLLMRLQQ